MGYALTWFGLAATLAGVFLAWLIARRRRKGDPQAV
jgi:LPXTG-motif cell wall-anchored protein